MRGRLIVPPLQVDFVCRGLGRCRIDVKGVTDHVRIAHRAHGGRTLRKTVPLWGYIEIVGPM
jgi:hypothetical protein